MKHLSIATLVTVSALLASASAFAELPEFNKCSHEAMEAAEAVAKGNGAAGVTLTSRVASTGIQIEGGLQFNYQFTPVDANGTRNDDVTITVETLESAADQTCSIRNILVDKTKR